LFVPIPVLLEELTLMTSTPPSEIQTVSAEGKKIPVFVSPLGEIDGILVVPADTVVIPLFTMPLLAVITPIESIFVHLRKLMFHQS